MKKSLTALALGVLMMAPPVLVPDASAAHSSWVFGAGFWVNGIRFEIGYVPRHGYAPDYYFRAKAPLRYRGYRCSDRCHRQSSYHYHHRSCPVVRHHLGRHGFDFGAVFGRYAPDYGYGGYGGYERDRGYRDRGYRDRGYRDGYYRGRGYDDGYYRRPSRRYRDRGHRHSGGSCPY